VALLSLLVDTKDPGIAEKIATVYEKAPELAGRYVSNAEERLGTSLANTLDGTTQGIRMAALQVAGTVNGQSTFHFLTQAATQGEDDSVKLQAALALANRGDFTDRQFLQQVRTKLRPDLGKSLDALR
jgi:HEAT repeat protein